MAKITKNVVRNYETQADTNTVAVAAGAHVFQGMLLGLNAGYARPYQAGDKIIGFAKEEADNTNGQAGDVKVDVKARGKVCLEIAGVAQANIGDSVIATDDDTFALDTDGDYFGKVLRLENATSVIVAFDFLYTKESEPVEDSGGGSGSGEPGGGSGGDENGNGENGDENGNGENGDDNGGEED